VKSPEDFVDRAFKVFGSEEMSEPLIFAYRLLGLIYTYRNTKKDSLTLLLANGEIQYISSSNENFKSPLPFEDHSKTCIFEIFERDTLVKELFDYEVMGENLKIMVKDK
jgi:hypothetical protein